MAGVDVVVLGSGLNALGVLRSLGGRGLKLVLVSRNAAVLPAYSRFVHKHVIAGDAIHDPEAILALSGAARGEAALLLTEELDTAACLADVAAWRERFRTCFYTPEVAAKLLKRLVLMRCRDRTAPRCR